MLKQFIQFNIGLSNKIEPLLPHSKDNIYLAYEERVGQEMNARGGLVVDVGGGKSCPFARYREPGSDVRIVAVDITAEEMEGNRDVDEKRVADVTERLPFKDGEVDILASRTVLEHLKNMDTYMAESHRVLKPGGMIIHQFPSRYAPFAVINRLLPHSVSERLLFVLRPELKGVAGYPAHYRGCYASAMRSTMAKHGFEIEELRANYYQSRYFSFFVPLYLTSALYEMGVKAVGAKNLASSLLLVARKK